MEETWMQGRTRGVGPRMGAREREGGLRDDAYGRHAGTRRELGLFFVGGFWLCATAVAVACGHGEGSPTAGTADAQPEHFLPLGDAASVSTFCATADPLGSTCHGDCSPNAACACGEQTLPLDGPPTAKCPADDGPYLCVLNKGPRDGGGQQNECSCIPKCASGTFTLPPQGPVEVCHCGGRTGLPDRYPDVADRPVPSCSGFAVCCRGRGACDCSADPGYGCGSGQTKVERCTPDDFTEQDLAEYTFINVSARVDRCR
jgi:hypothetical protein